MQTASKQEEDSRVLLHLQTGATLSLRQTKRPIQSQKLRWMKKRED